MITNRLDGGWEIIYQRAHALLAAKLVTYWREADRPLRWTETLNAISQHDNGWQEWEEGGRLNADGTPRDFTQMPLVVSHLQAARAVTRAWHQSQWVGLLVSRHISFLYERRRGELREMDDLLDEQIAQRLEWRRVLRVTEEEVEAAYSILRLGDAFSLILCLGKLPPAGQWKWVQEGPDGTPYHVGAQPDGTLSVHPWPYERDRFKVSVDTFKLDQVTFDSEDDLARALHRAQPNRQVWELARSRTVPSSQRA